MGRKERRAEAREKNKEKPHTPSFGVRLACYGMMGLAALSFYYGSYLPLRKLFIVSRSVHAYEYSPTPEKLKSEFDKALAYNSPVGQDGTVDSALYQTTIFIRQSSSWLDAKEAARYSESIADQENPRHLAALLEIYYKILLKYQSGDDIQKVEDYGYQILKTNPKSPLALYTLFDLYGIEGQPSLREQMGGQIIKYWPSDAERIKDLEISTDTQFKVISPLAK